MATRQMDNEAFLLRGEMIKEGGQEFIALLEDDKCIGLINAMCQTMADSGCRAGSNN